MYPSARSVMFRIARNATPVVKQSILTSRHIPSIANSSAAIRFSSIVIFKNQQQQRTFISPSFVARMASGADIDKGVQGITDLFMIARDELEYAEEARGTTYYNDDKETARVAVVECLETYDQLLKDCDQDQKLDIQRKIGLKILELKSQLDALNAEELE
ncbi:hypothetical protein BG004_007478 [Podila humilis]|nr:hypothetical protein BG004_007478 [Podila humilis]